MLLHETTSKTLDASFADLVQGHQQKIHPQECNGLVQKVYRHIVDGICDQEWLAGEKINEAKVARELGISHVPVREAMERLRQEGWVERIPKRGVFIREFNLETTRDLFQIREMLEAEAVWFVAPKITTEQLNSLNSIVELRASAQEADNYRLMRETDTHFHRLLIHFVGNPRLEQMFESILLQARGVLFLITNHLPFYAHAIQKVLKKADHQHIYAALECHEPELAVQLVREHVRAGCLAAAKLAELTSELTK